MLGYHHINLNMIKYMYTSCSNLIANFVLTILHYFLFNRDKEASEIMSCCFKILNHHLYLLTLSC